MVKKMSAGERFEQWLERAKALRAAYHEGEAAFFAHLVEGETDEEAWRTTGKATWLDVIEDAHLTTAEKYNRYRIVVEQHGAEFVRHVGVDCAGIVLAIPVEARSNSTKEPARQAVITALENFRVKNRTTPSPRHAQAIVREHYVPERSPKGAVSETYDSIKSERDRLRAELAQVKADRDARVAELTAEVNKLRERLAGARVPRVARGGKMSGKSPGNQPRA